MKNNGYVVVMIGDGVNDIFVLREVDIFIVMVFGFEVVRNVSYLVLMDFNFVNMFKVVSEG